MGVPAQPADAKIQNRDLDFSEIVMFKGRTMHVSGAGLKHEYRAEVDRVKTPHERHDIFIKFTNEDGRRHTLVLSTRKLESECQGQNLNR